ncbi:hypothetical protein MaMV-DH010047 [Cyanophage MaMV-DH01]|nr:hypothetical protein MaMV-DH010047 [Cyanophage MaMV-DH01]
MQLIVISITPLAEAKALSFCPGFTTIGPGMGTREEPTGIGIVKLIYDKIVFALLVKAIVRSVAVEALLQQIIEKTETTVTPLGGVYTS